VVPEKYEEIYTLGEDGYAAVDILKQLLTKRSDQAGTVLSSDDYSSSTISSRPVLVDKPKGRTKSRLALEADRERPPTRQRTHSTPAASWDSNSKQVCVQYDV
jgi:hypothetical protein